MKRLTCFFLLLACVGASNRCPAQGFINLNFENPVLPLNDPDLFGIAISRAMPGWAGYRSGNPGGEPPGAVFNVFYNTISLGGSAICLEGPGSPYPAISGSYSAFLQRSFGGAYSIALYQVGQVPSSTSSLLFMGSSILSVSFSGIPLQTYILDNEPDHQLLAADISAFAGQIGELRFEIPAAPGVLYGSCYLDDIRFSATPIPEPGFCTLVLLGLGIIFWRRP